MMTYEEAKMQIQAIPEKIWNQLSEPDNEAINMAISALQAQDSPKQTAGSVQNVQNDDLISRAAAIDLWEKYHPTIAVDAMQYDAELRQLPSAQPEIVRCKDCKHRAEKPIADGRYWCDIHDAYMYYCSDAERRTDEADYRKE